MTENLQFNIHDRTKIVTCKRLSDILSKRHTLALVGLTPDGDTIVYLGDQPSDKVYDKIREEEDFRFLLHKVSSREGYA